MRTFFIIILSVSLIGAGLISPVRVFANEKYSLVDFYLLKGERFLEKEDYLVAMNQFLIVTLLDPAHQKARKYLLQPDINAFLKDKYDQYKLKKFLDLADQTDFVNSRIAYLDESNERLFEFIEKNNLITDKNRKNFETLSTMVKPKRDIAALTTKLEQIRDAHDVETLGLAVKLMRDQKEQSMQMLEAKQQINSQLRSLKQALLDKEMSRQRSVSMKEPDMNLDHLLQQLSEKESRIQAQDQQILSLRGELQEVRLEFSSLQGKMADTDRKLAELTKELAGMSLDGFGKQQMLDDKEAVIRQLSDQVRESQAQLQLVQGIIGEKDDRIAEFQAQLSQMEERLKATEAARLAEEDIEIQQPASDQGRPLLFPLGTGGSVVAAEEDLDDLKVKYQTLEDVLKEKESHIAELNQLVGLLDRKVISYRQSHSKKEQELVQVKGILEIYKGRLDDTCELLKQRDMYISEIEQQLRGLENLFDQNSLDFSSDSVAEEQGVSEETLPPPATRDAITPPGMIDSKAALPILESTKYRIENLMNAKPLSSEIIQY
ncbi:MAG TPA: hypothetical protein PLT76_05555 [Candidatus Omnitrophota bacterium]|nr:hypothetical protein [Candidatus Omnitrophota bacterium]HQO58169.1 hypothetical protein [Candidatus Omnitrophota bacterium]